MADPIRADFDLHGVVSIRVENARPGDLRAVERQLGPLRSPGVAEPDLLLRFVERIPVGGELRTLGRDEAAYDSGSFLVLRGKHKARTRVRIPMEQIGQSCEILCEHGLPAVPLLVPIVNLTALAKGFVPLHAAAMVWNGAGVVMTGWSKGGKTETLLAFMQRGARYVADEWCYLAADGRRIFGIPEPVRLWRWQLAQLPEIRRRLPWGSRARLAALATLPGLESRLPESVQRVGPGRALRRLSHFLGGQLHVNVAPERLFGAEAHAREAQFSHLVFVTSAQRPDTAARAMEPEEVADRMVHSLQFERMRLLETYRSFRFAFPHLSNAHLEKAEERERTLLRQAFSGKPAWCVEHPYPVELRQLFDCLEPLLR
jgi:hypothetical protein